MIHVLSKSQIAVLIAAFVIVAPLSVILFWPNLLHPEPPQVPGTFILQIGDPWTAPSGKTVSGFVAYTPKAGTISNIFGPTLSGITPLAFSPDGSEVLGTLPSASSTSLVRVSLASQDIDVVIADPARAAFFPAAAWSPDASKVAYYEIPSLMEFAHSSEGKSYFVTNGATSTLRADVTLPAAYAPQLYVLNADGSDAHALSEKASEQGMPVAFAPDGAHALVATLHGLDVLSADGSSVHISGVSELEGKKVYPFFTSEDGGHIAMLLPGGGMTIYDIDWNTGLLSSIGTLSTDATQGYFSGDGTKLLLINPAGSATIVDISGGTLKTAGTYPLPFPPGIRIVRWTIP